MPNGVKQDAVKLMNLRIAASTNETLGLGLPEERRTAQPKIAAEQATDLSSDAANERRQTAKPKIAAERRTT